MKKNNLLVVVLFVIVSVVFGLIRCSSSSDKGDDTTTDTQIDPVSKVCSNIPRCFNGSYPAYFGKSKKECISKIKEIVSEEDIQILIDAGTSCTDITPIINKYEGQKTCEILKNCMGDAEFANMFGTIDGCIQYGNQKQIKEEDFKCVERNSSNCEVVANFCLAKYNPDAGVEDVGADVEDDAGQEKACVTDTRTYYCEDVCAKFYTCTGEYCPQGGCTKESCIHGCKTESVFTVELMCCLMEKPCSEIQTCIPK